MVEAYFFDTYALIEIIKGNHSYLKYIDSKIITTNLNLLELYSSLLRNYDKDKADYYFNIYSKKCVLIEDEDLKEAVKLWLLMRKENKKPSYIDCIGYVLAKRLDIKFLTGDREFKDMQNVEFVK